MIPIFAKLASAGDMEAAAKLYAMVASRIRSRLAPEDAAIVAAWFDQLAKGETPDKVFPRKRPGRPKNTTNTARPDDFDIANIVRQSLAAGLKPAEVYKGVAKAHRMKPRTVANIYGRLKSQL